MKAVFSIYMGNEINRILLKNKLIKSNTGDEYFKLGEYKIYYRSSYSVNDQSRLMDAVTLILQETFISFNYFSNEVNLNKGQICFDVGGAIGTTSLLFSNSVGATGRVFTIEPLMFDVIEKNMQVNKIGNVTVIPKGLSNYHGRGEIGISDFYIDSSIAKREYTKSYYKNVKEIEVTTLDSLVEELNIEKVDLIKLDIEGAEELALEGTKECIKRFKPKWTISSYHIGPDNKPQHDRLVEFLRSFSYNIKEVEKYHIYAW